jgi:hypothetical protein
MLPVLIKVNETRAVFSQYVKARVQRSAARAFQLRVSHHGKAVPQDRVALHAAHAEPMLAATACVMRACLQR